METEHRHTCGPEHDCWSSSLGQIEKAADKLWGLDKVRREAVKLSGLSDCEDDREQ